jgi:hypothetical protein
MARWLDGIFWQYLWAAVVELLDGILRQYLRAAVAERLDDLFQQYLRAAIERLGEDLPVVLCTRYWNHSEWESSSTRARWLRGAKTGGINACIHCMHSHGK